MTETLTESDRYRLDQKGERKALRIIDTQAAALGQGKVLADKWRARAEELEAENGQLRDAWASVARAHGQVSRILYDQPAAPACGSCRDEKVWSSGMPCPVCQPSAPTRAGTPECTVQVVCAAADRVGQPAAPARTEACEHGQVGYCGACCLLDEPVPTKPARAKAEQAVPNTPRTCPTSPFPEMGDGEWEEFLDREAGVK